jgi:2-C-methyl-D-erythritol 2,4-cyclodiphosphate synthase
MNHVGIGYDVHQLVEGRKLVLGGVEIPHEKGLDGHSDADVLMHAICDAVLGALGEGDIGHFFPNTDPRWKGAPSKVFLQEAARQVAFREGKIVNVDATLIAQRPKIAPHIHEMKIKVAEALGLNINRVGIAAMAVASVELAEPKQMDPA